MWGHSATPIAYISPILQNMLQITQGEKNLASVLEYCILTLGPPLAQDSVVTAMSHALMDIKNDFLSFL